MRVLLAPHDVAGVAGAIARALRRRGHDAELAVLQPHPFGYPNDRLIGGLRRRAIAAAREPLRHEVLHFQFGRTVIGFLDAAWARALRRTCLMHYWGDDCRTHATVHRLHPARARSWHAIPRSDWQVRARLQAAGRTCVAAICSDLELASYLTPYFRCVYLVPTPLELPLARAEPEPLAPGGPVAFHAPSHSALKGTREIVAALERVASRRPLRPRTVTGVPHAVVLGEIARADVVVDQLNSETPGVFALEAMALGRPVLVEFDRGKLAPFARDVPLVPVTPDTLAGELEALLDDAGRRAELGRAGAGYVRRVHDADRVAAAVERVYEHAAGRPSGLFEALPDGVRPLRSPLS